MTKTVRVPDRGTIGAAEDLIGQQLANYRVVRLLGRGGMGAVYEAVHLYLGRKAAIKVLLGRFAQNPQIAARFVNEARAANVIQHPGVVSIFEIGQTPEGLTYIVMELLEGVSLKQRIAQLHQETRPLWLQQASGASRVIPPYASSVLHIGRQLASTLCALHERGVIHRDLKPDNIFLVADAETSLGERVKLLDFGVAKMVEDCTAQFVSPLPGVGPRQRTAVGVVIGTPTHMSPEQWRGSAEITDRVDVYALGGILFELLTGRPPFLAEAIGDLLAQHVYQAAPPLSSIVPWVPPALSEFVQRMLAKPAGDRPSMAQVAQFLDRAYAQIGRSYHTSAEAPTQYAVQPSPSVPPQPPIRIHLGWRRAAIGASAVLGLGLLLSILLWRAADAPEPDLRRLPPHSQNLRSTDVRTPR